MYTMDELNDKLLSELKDITEELKIKGVSKLSKQDLIYKILDEQAISKPKGSSSKSDKPKEEGEKTAKKPAPKGRSSDRRDTRVRKDRPDQRKNSDLERTKPMKATEKTKRKNDSQIKKYRRVNKRKQGLNIPY